MKEVQILESKELREKCINRIEVLDRVKKLLLIPQTELATVKQVAEYYEVDVDVIQRIYQRNQDELISDGVKVETTKKFLNEQNVQLENLVGKSILTFSTGEKLEIPNRGLKIFPKRAILRVGMLLRDSEVAKEIRTRLLDIVQDTEDKAPEIIQQVTTEITIEQQLEIEVGKAYISGDIYKFAEATMRLNNYRNELHNKRVAQLENDNKALANSILTWEDRSKLNYGVRRLAGKLCISIPEIWNELYRQLLYKYHINLKARGKNPFIQYIKEYEWENVIKCFSALCKHYGQSPTEIFRELEVA